LYAKNKKHCGGVKYCAEKLWKFVPQNILQARERSVLQLSIYS